MDRPGRRAAEQAGPCGFGRAARLRQTAARNRAIALVLRALPPSRRSARELCAGRVSPAPWRSRTCRVGIRRDDRDLAWGMLRGLSQPWVGLVEAQSQGKGESVLSYCP